jgi:phage N-6-adenine-methyltransferase
MTSVVPVLSEQEARSLTEAVKRDAQALWRRFGELYERGAHLVLGYATWHDYCAAEFSVKQSSAYRLLSAGRVLVELERHSPSGEWPANEAQARELAPLRSSPEVMSAAWREAVDKARASGRRRPVAADVRRAVVQRQPRCAVHFSSATDEWTTPQLLFDKLDAEFGFELDVCALDSSAKCARYFTPDTDGLAQQWCGVCWMNPPYGDAIRRWVEKAHDAALADATVVGLLPARVDTGWWWDYCLSGEIRFLRGRLKFGTAKHVAPFPSAVVVFGRKPRVKWWSWQ